MRDTALRQAHLPRRGSEQPRDLNEKWGLLSDKLSFLEAESSRVWERGRFAELPGKDTLQCGAACKLCRELQGFTSSKWSLILLPGRIPRETHWFPTLDFRSTLTLVCCWFSIWGWADIFSCLPKSSVTWHDCQRSAPMHRHSGIAGWWPSVMVTVSFSATPRMAQVSYKAQEIWPRNER